MVQGSFEVGSQHHFHLETHTCLVRPIEDGQFEVHSATQWITYVQKCVARALGIDNHAIDMKVRIFSALPGTVIWYQIEL